MTDGTESAPTSVTETAPAIEYGPDQRAAYSLAIVAPRVIGDHAKAVDQVRLEQTRAKAYAPLVFPTVFLFTGPQLDNSFAAVPAREPAAVRHAGRQALAPFLAHFLTLPSC